MSSQRLLQILWLVILSAACHSSAQESSDASLMREVPIAEEKTINSEWLSEARDEPVRYLKVSNQAGDSIFMRLLLVPSNEKTYVTGNGFLHEQGDIIWVEGWADSLQITDIQLFTQDSLLIGTLQGKLTKSASSMMFTNTHTDKQTPWQVMNRHERAYFHSRIVPLLNLRLTAYPNKAMHYFGIHPQQPEYKLWIAAQSVADGRYLPQAMFIATAATDDVIQYLPLGKSSPIAAGSLPEFTRKSKQYFDLQDINNDNYADIRFMEIRSEAAPMYRHLIYDRDENIFLPLPLVANDYFRAQK